MKRLGMLGAAVVFLLLGTAPPVWAQFSLGDTPGARTPAYTVSFNGQMRFIGAAWNNLNDFTDNRGGLDVPCGPGTNNATLNTSPAGACKDSRAQFIERLRWWLTIESADKKAKIVWNAQVGDITAGNGSGVSDELGSTPAGSGGRVGTNGGGGAGARGVNLQTRQIYIAFDPVVIPNAKVAVGTQYLQFMDGPANEVMGDNQTGISFFWTSDPVDLNFYYFKVSENDVFSADDNDFYGGRLGVKVTPDIRLTLEGLLGSWQCFQRRPLATGGAPANTTLTNKGSCVDTSFATPFWVGTTANAKFGSATIYGAFLYGERPIYSNDLNKNFKERGYAIQLIATVPIGPLTTSYIGWYTSGDKHRPVGNGAASGTPCVKRAPGGRVVISANATGSGEDCSTTANTTNLNANSDKFPVPETGDSWGSIPYVLDFLTGNNTVGGPTALAQLFAADVSGTWGVGGAVTYALTPAFNVNFGAGVLGPSETKNAACAPLNCSNSPFGDFVWELDAGPRWTINANMSIQGVLGVMIPDRGDLAYGGIFRAIYFF